MPHSTANPVPESTRFQQDTAEVITRLRDLLEQWVGSVDDSATTPSQLQRATKLDMKLCWKVFKVIDAPDPLSAALYVPGSANLRSLIRWIERKGGDRAIVVGLEEALASLDDLVRQHAGDRQTFDTMVSQWARDEEEKLDLTHRRAAFRANCHIWGMQAEAMLSCYIMCTSQHDPALLDGALLTSTVGLRRLRQTDTPLFSQLVGVSDDDGVVRRKLLGEPLDPENSGDMGLSIVREFCSDNLPHIITHQSSDGFVHASLPNDMIGLKAATTITTGHLTWSFAGRYRDEHNSNAHHTVFIRCPVRNLFLDVILAEGTFGDVMPGATVYADRTGRLPFPLGDQSANLLSRESVICLGRGIRALHSSMVAKYPKLVGMAMDRLGVDPERCVTYRCRIDYPVMLSRAVLSFPLPARP